MTGVAINCALAVAVTTVLSGLVIVLLSIHLPDLLPGRSPYTRTNRARQQPWPYVWDHSAPAGRLTIRRAHRDTQRHRRCDTRTCARKAAALDRLILSGRVTLTGHHRHRRVASHRRRSRLR